MPPDLIDLVTQDRSAAMDSASGRHAPSLASSETITDIGVSFNEDEGEALKDSMKLIWKERENWDLKVKLSRVEEENGKLQEELAQLKYECATEVKYLKNTKLTLSDELESLKTKPNISNTESKVEDDNQNLIQDLTTTIARQQDKIDLLSDKNEELASKRFEALETARKSVDEFLRLNAKIEDKECEIKDLWAKLEQAEAVRDLQQDENSNVSDERNAENTERTSNQQIKFDSFKEKVDKLNEEKKIMATKIDDLKYEIAAYITFLDLSDCRLYTCEHSDLEAIPDNKHATTSRTKEDITDQFFRDWKTDEDFVRFYNHMRNFVLKHHRAHKLAAQGRGALTEDLKKRFLKADTRRGMAINYSL